MNKDSYFKSIVGIALAGMAAVVSGVPLIHGAEVEDFIKRVERIVVIDSIAVDSDTFFKAYRLPESAGVLLPPDSIPFEGRRGSATVSFANENRDFMMWAESDSTGFTRIAESILLTDGTWSTPAHAPDDLSPGGDADFPFMMADGTTLYYAADGEESMGGLDIFVATRDASSGEYLQPQNIGLPYNSPYDDYMLAIDELNGIGWWATDRNHLPGMVTVYVFLVNDVRQNYDTDEIDDEELRGLASINSYRATWQTDEDKSRAEEALAIVKSIEPTHRRRAIDFHFPVGRGKVYTSYDELPDATSRNAMRQYIDRKKELEQFRGRLDAARRKYHEKPERQLGNQIASMEKEEQTYLQAEKQSRRAVYEALGLKF